MDPQLKIELVILVVVLVIARFAYLIHKITTGHSKHPSTKRREPSKTIICIGSGGHTAEMLKLLENVDFNKFFPRYYILASSDVTSSLKVEELEKKKADADKNRSYKIIKIPRSREVGQSYFTSIVTTVLSILCSIPIVFKIRPDLILCNGPGTCIPICGLGFLLKCAFICDAKIVFIESFCRTKSFSLSGKILKYLADNFLVQWPSLKRKLKRADYIGQIM